MQRFRWIPLRAKRCGESRRATDAAIEEGVPGKGAAGGASPQGGRADERARGRSPAAGCRPMRRRAVPASRDDPTSRAANGAGREPLWRGLGGAELGRKGAAAKPVGRPPGCSVMPAEDAGQTGVCPQPRRRAMRLAVVALLPPSYAPETGRPADGDGRSALVFLTALRHTGDGPWRWKRLKTKMRRP